MVTLEVLDELEKKLAGRYERGADFRLCEFFDYIGGTSTGAIIAACLARGMSVAEVKTFYTSFGRQVFSKTPFYQRWQSLYEDGPLADQLKRTFGEHTTLEPGNLRTLLLVVTRNASTDSAWPISSNPDAKYNDIARKNCNLRVPLWKLVRASTAAPVYFPPEIITWDPNDSTSASVFKDGGTTSYNNPAFLMARMAMEPAYRLNWQRGEQDLLIVSVGTTSAPVLGHEATDPGTNLVAAASETLSALMSQAQFDQDLSCRTIGRCAYGPPLDREVGDLVPREGKVRVPLSRDLGRAFLYLRYDEELTFSGLSRLGLEDQIEPQLVRPLDAVEAMDDLACIGKAIATKIDLADFGRFAVPTEVPIG